MPHIIFLLALILLASALAAAPEPLRLHPDNPHYFLFRGKPTVLITSGEHYGAVLNLDFDYVKYLDTLHRDGLNNTRTFTGAYMEPDGSFNIAHNSMAPASGRLICPWARSDTPGYAGGGNKFDLTRWDDAYFARLKDFVSHASKRGIIVELDLFCPFYDDSQWAISPIKASNNVNGIGDVDRTKPYTLDPNDGLYKVQEAMVRKIVAELREFDNLYYEIMNEAYWGNLPAGWEHHIAEVITDAEKAFPHKHLISQNIANDKAKVEQPDRLVSIFNFHYAFPPDTVPMNYALNHPIGDNETGFKGTNDAAYRIEAWEFIVAGGGLYNNLDYSFVAGFEDGTFVYPAKQPGGGNPAFRQQMRILRDFIHGFEFVKMKPDHNVIKGGVPKGTWRGALAEAGKAYAIYLRAGAEKGALEVELPAGGYRAEWISPLSGAVVKMEEFQHGGGSKSLAAPEPAGEVALRIKKRSE